MYEIFVYRAFEFSSERSAIRCCVSVGERERERIDRHRLGPRVAFNGSYKLNERAATETECVREALRASAE